jgi:hypothetical protein
MSARTQKKETYEAHRGRVDRAQTQVRRENLPYDLGLEPHVGPRAAGLDVAARRDELERLQHGVVRRERFLGKARANLADRLELLAVGVVAREQERAVDRRTLALAVVAADDDEVERVADAREVVFFYLRGVVTTREQGRARARRTLSQLTLRWLGAYRLASPSSILTISPSQPSLTESFRNVCMSSTASLSVERANANSQSTSWKCSRKSSRRSARVFCSSDCIRINQLPCTRAEAMGTHLAVEVQQVEREKAYADLDIVDLDVLALAPAQLLERQQLLRRLVDRDGLRVEHKRLCRVFEALRSAQICISSGARQGSGGATHVRQLLDEIRVLLAHVLRVAAEDGDRPVREPVHLRALAIVLILAGKAPAIEAVEHLADRLGRLGEHRLERHARCQLALAAQAADAGGEDRGHDLFVRWEFAEAKLWNAQ